jgi:hypothetical protein
MKNMLIVMITNKPTWRALLCQGKLKIIISKDYKILYVISKKGCDYNFQLKERSIYIMTFVA